MSRDDWVLLALVFAAGLIVALIVMLAAAADSVPAIPDGTDGQW